MSAGVAWAYPGRRLEEVCDGMEHLLLAGRPRDGVVFLVARPCFPSARRTSWPGTCPASWPRSAGPGRSASGTGRFHRRCHAGAVPGPASGTGCPSPAWTAPSGARFRLPFLRGAGPGALRAHPGRPGVRPPVHRRGDPGARHRACGRLLAHRAADCCSWSWGTRPEPVPRPGPGPGPYPVRGSWPSWPGPFDRFPGTGLTAPPAGSHGHGPSCRTGWAVSSTPLNNNWR